MVMNKKRYLVIAVAALMLQVNNVTAQLKLANGATIIVGTGATLSARGNITNNGAITGSGITLLDGSSLQGIDGIGDFNNLTLNNTAGALISANGSSSQNIYGKLTISSGNLATNNNLTLRSNAAGTACVGNSAGTITGYVTVERFIANPGKRAWHLLSTNTYGSGQTIQQAWQENGGPVVAGVGTLVSSNVYNGSNGFDMASLSASLLTYNQGGVSGPGWNFNLSNTNTTVWSSYPGYMLYVRGDRTYNTANSPATGSTTLRSKGNLYQGTQQPVVVSATGTGRTLVGNPFASPIDLETIFAPATTLDQNFYIWDATLSGNYGSGGFRLVQRNGVGSYTATPGLGNTPDNTMRYIQSGQAFFLKATGSDASVVFDENSKAGSLSVVNPVASIQGDQQIIANLMLINAGTESLVDGIRLRFDDSYSPDLSDDIEKMGGFAENISLYRQGKKLIVEQRPMIVAADTIFLRVTNTRVNNYRFKINTQDFVQPAVRAWLQDSYLNSSTPLDMSGAVKDFDFSVTSDPASANTDRFRIVFSLNAASSVTFTSIKAYRQTVPAGQAANHIAVEWKLSNQLNIHHYEIERSTDGINYTIAGTQVATGSDLYSWLDVNAVTGNNFYRIRCVGNGGEITYSDFVKVWISKDDPAITVYPNPVVNQAVTLQFTGMPKGMYQVRLINITGQVVMVQQLNHAGGNALQTINIPKDITDGMYQIEIRQPGNKTMTQKLVIGEHD
jgi:hypothetical protein